MRATLNGIHQRRLVAGERCALLWPGAEMALWAPGSLAGHRGEVLESRHIMVKTKLPRGRTSEATSAFTVA
ncbi:hypothetical protein PG991_003869 [Apiospora marii]|uniref:Uncharacterized protein n=1 Tax=Apiospora marii TaxID=335849 RepID=A0ABR1S4N6_9PEZI